MNILVACEESQAVCKAFRDRGHNAYSCDVLECSGGHPEWHFKQGALKTFFVKSDSVCDLSCVFAIVLQKQRLQ